MGGVIGPWWGLYGVLMGFLRGEGFVMGSGDFMGSLWGRRGLQSPYRVHMGPLRGEGGFIGSLWGPYRARGFLMGYLWVGGGL